MQEIKLKTHLIITDIHEEYHMNWCGKLIDTIPYINNKGMPIFIIIGSQNRIEIDSININYIEECAKRITNPIGHSAITYDHAYIYIKEKNGNEKLLGILTHKRIKNFAPMYDRIGYK